MQGLFTAGTLSRQSITSFRRVEPQSVEEISVRKVTKKEGIGFFGDFFFFFLLPVLVLFSYRDSIRPSTIRCCRVEELCNTIGSLVVLV